MKIVNLRHVRGTLGIVASIAMLSTHGHAASLCAKPRLNGMYNTTVKIRDTCRSGENALDPAVLHLQGPAGLPGPTGPQGIAGTPGGQGPQGPSGPSGPGLVVRDADGATVGVVIGNNPTIYSGSTGTLGLAAAESVAVVMSMSSQVVSVLVDNTGFTQASALTGNVTVAYESGDCSGQPLFGQVAPGQTPQMFFGNVAYPQAPMIPTAAVSASIAYFQGGPASTKTVYSYASTGYGVGNCVGGVFVAPDLCCRSAYYLGGSPRTGAYAPVTTFDLGALNLKPPLHIEIQP